MLPFLRKLAVSRGFSYFVLGIIILAGVLVGLETLPDFKPDSPYGRLVDLLQQIVLWLFVAEAAIKIIARWPRPWEYFYDPWNIFDFIVIVICFLPLHAKVNNRLTSVRSANSCASSPGAKAADSAPREALNFARVSEAAGMPPMTGMPCSASRFVCQVKKSRSSLN